MTYGAFLGIFVLVPVLVLAVVLRRRISRRWLLGLLAVMALAVVYTGPWDHAIIGQGVWSYPSERVLGLTIGRVPIEEYGFFLLQVAMTGLVLLALTGRPVAPLPPACGLGGRNVSPNVPPAQPTPSAARQL